MSRDDSPNHLYKYELRITLRVRQSPIAGNRQDGGCLTNYELRIGISPIDVTIQTSVAEVKFS
ncbi:hypothetical protein NIES4103_03820 [Nostoc sp. NIES-4103]|nr:hypothetical protein NIES4103_03820 [Nostoc sp. NIES-4103]